MSLITEMTRLLGRRILYILLVLAIQRHERNCYVRKCIAGIKQIVKLNPNKPYKFKTHNNYAIPHLTYTFVIIKLINTHIEKINIKPRKLMM